MSSPIGRTMLRDVIADVADNRAAVKCCQYVQDALQIITARALHRGEAALSVAELTDRLIAPINYHILFGDREVNPEYCNWLLSTLPPVRQAAVAAVAA